jgi:2-dehydropantoate 2-reductase
MACLFAARLSAAGLRIAMQGAWQEGLAALRQEGVRLVEPGGAEQVYPVLAAGASEDLPPCPHALVLVKSWQTPRAAQDLRQRLTPDGLALTLQNGLGNRETLQAQLGAERVALGVTTLGANLLGPGKVRAAGEGPVVLEMGSGSRVGRIAALASLLRLGGFTVEAVDDPLSLLWGKLVINSAINPLTSLLQVRNGELLERESARQLMAQAACEAAAVAGALDIHLPYTDPVQAAEDVARRTASNRSSMLQDVLRGAPTEIEAICGEIVRLGQRLGVETPLNRALWQLVKAKVQG